MVEGAPPCWLLLSPKPETNRGHSKRLPITNDRRPLLLRLGTRRTSKDVHHDDRNETTKRTSHLHPRFRSPSLVYLAPPQCLDPSMAVEGGSWCHALLEHSSTLITTINKDGGNKGLDDSDSNCKQRQCFTECQ